MVSFDHIMYRALMDKHATSGKCPVSHTPEDCEWIVAQEMEAMVDVLVGAFKHGLSCEEFDLAKLAGKKE